MSTWNPSDCSAVITLSGGNLIASGNSNSPQGGVRSTTHYNSGKHYFEFNTVQISGGVGDSGIGICTAAAVLATMGNAAALAALVFNTGRLWINGSLVLSPAVPASPTTLGVALDLDNEKIWVWQGGNWNNDVIGNQNPATNTGGKTLSGFLTTGVTDAYLAFASDNNATHVTANFGATAFLYTAPSGFSSWDAFIPTLKRSSALLIG